MDVLYNDVKKLPITDYLLFKGVEPYSKVGREVYYISPFRPETRPSLTVNPTKNVWFDFGDNVGGSIIDLALRLFNWDRARANEDLARFAEYKEHNPGDQPSEVDLQRRDDAIRIINVRDISNAPLVQLITSRGIDIRVARRYCKEIWFESSDERRCFAIGLANILEGWELRGLKSFKCSTQPKAVSLIRINPNNDRVSVFEGLFDMLSYAAYCHHKYNAEPSCDLLCLNSLSLLNASYELLREYKEIDLYLDADNPGREATSKILKLHTNAKDKSKLYSRVPNCKDLNQWYLQYLKSI